ncbi:hypothetical protein [Paenibacillus aceti]|uniref:Uncharacterized protein n=1 Tax=Paenibacillus aceti TaxID=1820010 RepID=A0ABQ1W5A9_9BACL|nr:hypothetical protein [Paenibacillus aceti]GGG15776.1 hypothetical protein GCM10010913_42200 [Paenibacillus aceti]
MSDDVLEIANKRLIRAEFLIASRNAGVRTDALDAAYKLADLSGVSIDDSGKVWGVDDAIQELNAESKWLFAPIEKPKARTIG